MENFPELNHCYLSKYRDTIFRRLRPLLVIVVLLSLKDFEPKAQSLSQIASYKRTRENFDFNWQFHKGDIAIKRIVKVGGQGGITDINVKIISKEDTTIDYTHPESSKVLKPADWKEVNLPHDWVVEGTFVHDNSLGSQPAANGYLPTGIGFYRKEFEIPGSDKGKKISVEFDGIFRNSTVWVNGHLLGNHQSGYTPSNYDLTDILRYGKEGKNTILAHLSHLRDHNEEEFLREAIEYIKEKF